MDPFRKGARINDPLWKNIVAIPFKYPSMKVPLIFATPNFEKQVESFSLKIKTSELLKFPLEVNLSCSNFLSFSQTSKYLIGVAGFLRSYVSTGKSFQIFFCIRKLLNYFSRNKVEILFKKEEKY